MTTQHTPTPWYTRIESEGRAIFDGNGDEIFTVATTDVQDDEEKAEILEHIVRCVNAHDALVDALVECKFHFGRQGGNSISGPHLTNECRHMWEVCSAALAQVAP